MHSILTSLADSQHNYRDKYLLLFLKFIGPCIILIVE